MAEFHSLWLSSIPLCVSIYVYHIFFIHLSVDGQLGCFHLLAIVNNAAMNIRVHVSFQISVFVFDKYPGVDFLYHMVFLVIKTATYHIIQLNTHPCYKYMYYLLNHVLLCDPVIGSSPGSSVQGFSRQEYWSRLPCPSLGDLSNPGIKSGSPVLQADSLPSEPPGKPL